MKVKKTEYTLLEKQYEFLFGIPKEKLNNPNKIYNDISCYYGGMGAGKCLGYGTPVLMYDGTIKPVQDIKIGDILMGDDSTKRTVISLGRGKETMYKIIPNKGESFTCNESHILSLVHTVTGEVIDISVKEYLTKSNKFKALYKLFHSEAIEFTPTKPLDVHPYLYGLWLGDGNTDANLIWVNDKEILDNIDKFIPEGCYTIKKQAKKDEGTNLYNVRITSKNKYTQPLTRLRNDIKALSDHKRILHKYKVAPINDRRYLLAGILDSDGYGAYNSNKVVTTKYEDLANDYAFIARSLGFRANVLKKVKKLKYKNNELYTSYDVSISGDFSTLPMLVERKKSVCNNANKNPLRTGFKIECMGEGDYYGFTLKENPRFLLGDFTVTHNTFSGSLRGLTYALLWDGCRGLVGAKSQDLLDNTTKRKYIEHMENIGLQEGVHYWWSDRGQTLNFVNGSVIRFKTLSDWQQFMSEEFAWIEFEEASFLEEIVFIKLLTRLRQAKREGWRGFHRSLFMHTNPQGKRGWINKFFVNPKTKKESYRFISASTRDNPYLGDEYVEMLEEAYSAEQVKEMIDGLDVDYDNTVAFPDFTTDNIFDDLEYDPNYPLILTCDFNYNPMCWYLMQEIDGTWHVLEELIRNNVTTKEMCQQIQPILDMYKTKKLIIMGDSHGKDRKTNGSDYNVMLAHYTDAGYDCTLRVQKSNPLIKDRLAVLRGLIRNAKGVRRLKVKSTCKWLLYNFEECVNQLANGGLKIPTDSEIQQDDNKRYLIHPIDAISYPMHYLSSLRAIAGEQEKL